MDFKVDFKVDIKSDYREHFGESKVFRWTQEGVVRVRNSELKC